MRDTRCKSGFTLVELQRHDPNSGPTYRCNYRITSFAYREKGGEEIGRSILKAELRLDPCIAYWAGSSTTVRQRITINGDVYCNGALSGNGYIGGDAFASGKITAANIEGQKNENVSEAPVGWPGLEASNFSSKYYIGSATYSTHIVDSIIHPEGDFNPSTSNPAGVRYCSGDVELSGGVNIKGMLVVDGTLKVSGANNTITAVKNFPALLVSGEVIVEDGGTLEVKGLAQIGQGVVINPGVENVDINVLGGLFVANGGIEAPLSSSVFVNVTAAPAIASIQVWPGPDTAKRWGPAGGAFFKSIGRK